MNCQFMIRVSTIKYGIKAAYLLIIHAANENTQQSLETLDKCYIFDHT